MNIPNFLSVSRIFLLIPVITLFESGFFLLSLTAYILASITDYLDGYFARQNNQTSDIGALLDLLADKLFVSILLIWMTSNFDNTLILVSAILIVSREISISYLRLLIVSKSKHISEVKSDILGKYKTAIQMTGLGLILITPITPNLFFNASLVLLIFSAIISWYSLIKYLKKWIL
tara:strand:+ start:346 stop:873 length:528 start_codon:yes stop_codon:yes gene_type:complete